MKSVVKPELPHLNTEMTNRNIPRRDEDGLRRRERVHEIDEENPVFPQGEDLIQSGLNILKAQVPSFHPGYKNFNSGGPRSNPIATLLKNSRSQNNKWEQP